MSTANINKGIPQEILDQHNINPNAPIIDYSKTKFGYTIFSVLQDGNISCQTEKYEKSVNIILQESDKDAKQKILTNLMPELGNCTPTNENIKTLVEQNNLTASNLIEIATCKVSENDITIFNVRAINIKELTKAIDRVISLKEDELEQLKQFKKEHSQDK